MTSQLASQLQKLQQRSSDDSRLSDSFLFSKADARSFSREQVLELAISGLQTLVSIDNRLHFFIDDLFNRQRARQERKLLTSEENKALDRSLEHFLTLLSPHLFLTAAQQVFEYLVRVHEVHVFSPQAVLRAFLPYHDHNLFARALLLLDLRDTGFDFLVANQERGAPLLREQLILACGESRKALRLVCLTMAMSVRVKVHHNAANALFASVACGLSRHADAESLWRTLLPFVVEFMSGTASGAEAGTAAEALVTEEQQLFDGVLAGASSDREAVCTALVVLAMWGAEATFSLQMMTTVMKPILALLRQATTSLPVVAVVDLLALVDLLFQTQLSTVTQVPFAPQLNALLALPWPQLVPLMTVAVADANQKGVVALESLVTVLVHFCLERLRMAHSISSVPQDICRFLRIAAEELPLANHLVKSYLQALVMCEYVLGTEARSFFNPIVAALERRHQSAFDAALSELLSKGSATKLSDTDDDNDAAAAVSAFLSCFLSGTRYEVLEVQGARGTAPQRLPLFACLLHPLPEVRRVGVASLRTMTLDQLTSSSSVSHTGGPAAGGSLMELLAHVARYEPDAETARGMLQAAAAALVQITAALRTAEELDESTTERFAFYCAAVKGLLHSLSTLSSIHGAGVRCELFNAVLAPLMEQTAPKPQSSKKSGAAARGRNEQSATTVAALDSVRAATLYHLTLLYLAVTAADHLEINAAESPRAAMEALLHQHFPTLVTTSEAVFALTATTTTTTSTNRAARKRTKASSDSSDGDNDDQKCEEDAGERRSATQAPGSPTLVVLDNKELLHALLPEARARLPAVLQDARTALKEAATAVAAASPVTLECALAVAACLAGDREQCRTSEPTSTEQLFLRFLVVDGDGSADAGAGAGGYLGLLQDVQRAAAAPGEPRAAVGRGAKNSLTAAPYLPHNAFTVAMASVVQRAVRSRLSAGVAECPETIAVLLRLLGYLGAPLPVLAEDAVALPPALMRLLQSPVAAREAGAGEESALVASRFVVDWFLLVQAAVLGETASPQASGFSLAALAVTLLFPLCAPSAIREKLLQTLQDLVLRAASERPLKGGSHSSALLVLVESLRGKHAGCSVTLLSALLESMAREESRFTLPAPASQFICALLAEDAADGSAPAVPYGLATRLVTFFFAVPEASSAVTTSRKAGSQRAILSVSALLPRMTAMLRFAAGAIPVDKTGKRMQGTSSVSEVTAGGSASADAADFLEAVCSRVLIVQSDGPASENPAVQLSLLLLQYPQLRVSGGAAARPVYRHALSTLAVALSSGSLKDATAASSSTLIFSRSAARTSKASGGCAAGELTDAYADSVAECVSAAVVRAVEQIGTDACRLCAQTLGGYHRVFLPLVASLSTRKSSGDAASAGLEVIIDVLDALAPDAQGGDGDATEATAGWRPPIACVVSNPLQYQQAVELIDLCKSISPSRDDAVVWRRDAGALKLLRLLTAILRVSPAVHMDDDEADESLTGLVMEMLTKYPLDAMVALLVPTSVSQDSLATLRGSHRLMDSYARQVFALLMEMVGLCSNQRRALCEKDASGAFRVRSTLIKQGLVLTASLLLGRSGRGTGDPVDKGAAAVSRQRIDCISELLRVLAPLLAADCESVPSPMADGERGAQGAGPNRFLLHIPLVALLIRLEPYEHTEALRYSSAAEVCMDILTSFDIHTQISSVAQLMRLVMDPAAQLETHADPARQTRKGAVSEEEENGEAEDDLGQVVRLFRRMVKPNQIINRQEALLNLITTTVKSDAFLAPFIELQHHANSRGGKAAAAAGTHKDEEEALGAEDDEERTMKAEEGTRTNDECMNLLVCALELFSHYSDLNSSTPNDVARSRTGSDVEELFGEQKTYTMLLELLSGNALACVLAGINEPTFVECENRLLRDSHISLQLKGLEVLLDRLHHSLPTVENTLSDEELEQHRRDLRDPKRKLTLVDLVRVKARPLTTKRSFSLFSHLTALMQAAMRAVTEDASATPSGEQTQHERQLYRMLHLCVACAEELIRIVSSGGSTQAEKTLLNVNRGKRVTEAALAKLFGNKRRVQEVHQLVGSFCDTLIPQFTRTLQRHLRATTGGGDAGAVGGAALEVRQASEEDLLVGLTFMITALGTTVQVMGAAFTMPHCAVLLETVVSAALFQTCELPGVVARGEAGALLRHTTLSCLIRCLPSCWQMSQPLLPHIFLAAAHIVNVDDGETHYLCSEILTVMEALMDPQTFLEAGTSCLRGIPYVNVAVLSGADRTAALVTATAEIAPRDGKRRQRFLRLQPSTHSFPLFFGCIQRRVLSLKKEDLARIGSLMMEGGTGSAVTAGATSQHNFWLAALQSLASAVSMPPSEVVVPVLEAFTAFFLKFKPKHCRRFLRVAAEWAFGGDATQFSKLLSTHSTAADGDDDEESDRGNRPLSRTVLQSWLLFYALFNHLLEKLGAILEFGFPVALPYVVTTLVGFCSSSKAHNKPLGSLIPLALEGALDSVRRMALAQTPGPDHDHSVPLDVHFAVVEVFNSLMPALVHQLTNTTFLTDDVYDFSFRAEHAVIPAVRAFFSCLNSSKLQSKTQAELVRGLRHPSRHVRRFTIQCLDGIYADGGEDLAARLMAEMLPAVVELTEDRDEAVVEAARKFCTALSHITGQDVLHAMS